MGDQKNALLSGVSKQLAEAREATQQLTKNVTTETVKEQKNALLSRVSEQLAEAKEATQHLTKNVTVETVKEQGNALLNDVSKQLAEAKEATQQLTKNVTVDTVKEQKDALLNTVEESKVVPAARNLAHATYVADLKKYGQFDLYTLQAASIFRGVLAPIPGAAAKALGASK